MEKNIAIVVAWTEEGAEFVQERRTDLGERPVMRAVLVAKAALWKACGTSKDLEKAEVYARANGYTVLTYPTSERHPQARARVDILKK